MCLLLQYLLQSCSRGGQLVSLRTERFSRILETRGKKIKASAFDELLPDFSRLTTFIEDEYKSACLAEDVGGGYSGNMQNCVCSSSTNGIQSQVSPMMRPELGPWVYSVGLILCPCVVHKLAQRNIPIGYSLFWVIKKRNIPIRFSGN